MRFADGGLVSVAEQLELRPIEETERQHRWFPVLQAIRAAAVRLQDAAYALDLKPSRLANQLAQRDGHVLAAESLLYFIDQDAEVLRLLADVAGYTIVRKRELTPNEQLAALRDALDESLGPELRASVLAKAARKAAERGR